LPALVLALLLPVRTAGAQSRSIVAAFTDDTGAPIAGLMPAEVEIRAGSKIYRVTRLTPVAGTMRIALLVDNGTHFTPSIALLRTGLHALVEAIPEQDEIALATIAGHMRTRLAPTADRRKVDAAIDALPSDPGAVGAPLYDAFAELDRRVFSNSAARPVIVIVVADGPDTSGVQRDVVSPQVQPPFVQGIAKSPPPLFRSASTDVRQPIDRLQQRGASFHTLVLKRAGDADASRTLATSLSELSGGSSESIVTDIDLLPDKLRRIGAAISDAHANWASEYVIEFTATPSAGEEAEIVVKRPGVRIDIRGGRAR
jgi:hypothetical protein